MKLRSRPQLLSDHSSTMEVMDDEEYDHFGNVQVSWALLGAAQNASSAEDFAAQIPGLLADTTGHLGEADMAQVTASLQTFVLKYEVHLLGRPPSDFAPNETGGEVLWRLTEARRSDSRERMLELAGVSLVDAHQIIKAAEARGMDIGQF